MTGSPLEEPGSTRRRRRTALIVVALVAAVVAAALVAAVLLIAALAPRFLVAKVDGKELRPTSAKNAAAYYAAHRGEFAELLRLVNSGALGDPDTWDYYGPALPPHLCHLSATCKVSNFNSSAAGADARTARVYGARASTQLYVPAWVGTPDDSAGLAHFDDTPKGPFDGYGQLDCPAAAVGDGWWWLDRCGR